MRTCLKTIFTKKKDDTMQPEDYEEKQYEDEPESYPIDEFQLTTTP
ncbi:DUF262 domain-containing protein, partial [Escherichia coli]|nr:DUF262 domain-containing protein [Escherichia coli]